MGYTHYWREKENLDAERFKAFSDDARKIVAGAQSQGIKLVDLTGEGGEPEVTSELVSFNGLGDDSHESFVIDLKFSDFEFCKTATKPYDTAVTACLIAFKKHFGDVVRVSSDGDDPDWNQGRQLCEATVGYGSQFHIGEDGLTDTATESAS